MTVETAFGRIRGVDVQGIKTFKGIPYGASTGGKNRFMPPANPAAWTGVRDALSYGPSAPQRNPDAQLAPARLTVAGDGLLPDGEDCLALNDLHHIGPTQYLYASNAYPGRIYKLTLDGKVVGMLGTAGRQLKQFNWLHSIACPSENELYVADLNNWRVQKLILHPEN